MRQSSCAESAGPRSRFTGPVAWLAWTLLVLALHALALGVLHPWGAFRKASIEAPATLIQAQVDLLSPALPTAQTSVRRPTPSEPTPSEPTPSEPTPSEPTPSEPTPRTPAWATETSVRPFRVYSGDYTEGHLMARMTHQVEVSPPHYLLRAWGQAEGLLALVFPGALTQESRGRLGPQGLAPERYEEVRGSRRSRSMRFDQEGAMLLPADASPSPLPSGTQDRLSVIYQLGFLARVQPERFVPGALIELPVAGRRDVRLERFEVVGPTDLIVGHRRIPALHLKRAALGGDRDAAVQLWLGYDAGLHPVRVRLEDARGQVLDQVIDEQ